MRTDLEFIESRAAIYKVTGQVTEKIDQAFFKQAEAMPHRIADPASVVRHNSTYPVINTFLRSIDRELILTTYLTRVGSSSFFGDPIRGLQFRERGPRVLGTPVELELICIRNGEIDLRVRTKAGFQLSVNSSGHYYGTPETLIRALSAPSLSQVLAIFEIAPFEL